MSNLPKFIRNGNLELTMGALLVTYSSYYYLSPNTSTSLPTLPSLSSEKPTTQMTKFVYSFLPRSLSGSNSENIKPTKTIELPWDTKACLTQPSVLHCTIKKLPSGIGFDGPYSLKHANLKLDTIVEVLEEHVGPGGGYHLCRYDGKIGWYPVWFLAVVVPPDSVSGKDGGEENKVTISSEKGKDYYNYIPHKKLGGECKIVEEEGKKK